ncbi:MAG: hypothetical protein HZB43_07075 [candidate division Zixibacteria bacterium]|nr:hypothetical protein [candidate division Zixibacteria bacterium]
MRVRGLVTVAICLLLISPRSVSGGTSRNADSIRVILATLLPTWGGNASMLVPETVSAAFCRTIPASILSQNVAGLFGEKGFTVESMRVFYAAQQLRLPSDSFARDWACYIGGNSGYFAIVEERDSAARLVWSAYPTADVSQPSIDFVELTGDSIPEIVLSGLAGLHMHMNGEVFSWNGKDARWLTTGDSVLSGYYWDYEPTGVGVAKKIVIYGTPTFDRAAEPLTRQIVEYDTTRKVLVWHTPEVVPPKK